MTINYFTSLESMLKLFSTINEHLSTGGTDANHDLTGSTIRHYRTINRLEGERRLPLQVPQLSPVQSDRRSPDAGVGL